jgi:hypothetical protein
LIRLALAVMCLCGSAQAEILLRQNGVMRWERDAPWFGGWSGIEISAQGTQMTVISDRGQIAEATLERSGGQLSGARITSNNALSGPEGAPLRRFAADAEGLAIAEDGRAFISFEHQHRIMEVDRATGRTSGRINLPFRAALGDNAGIEALAVGPDGTLYALAENPPSGGAAYPLHAYADGQWRVAAHIPQRGPFVPVGADFDPLGRLWVLERALTLVGFRSRIRMFVIDPRAPVEVTVLTTFPSQHDNLEGISLWQDAQGQLHLTMVSDDNFLRIQQTQIVEYLVEE